ncbi:MAG TPA: hypothetical protein VGL49_02965 [Acidimicrobiales bacterium]|jgi:hypothetical protein
MSREEQATGPGEADAGVATASPAVLVVNSYQLASIGQEQRLIIAAAPLSSIDDDVVDVASGVARSAAGDNGSAAAEFCT